MKIAVIGSGIAGLSAAYFLHKEHEVHVFEAAPRIGGHTATINVDDAGSELAVDTGFIVYNDRTYPEFIALLEALQVQTQCTEMSFSVSDAKSGIEYAGSSLNTLFAQRRNLVSPKFWRLLSDIVRFNSRVERDLLQHAALANATLGEYLEAFGYSSQFNDLYLLPMGAAIWSSDQNTMLNFPLQFFVKFFRNHGLLDLTNRPQWHVIKGGSAQYLGPLTKGFHNNLHINTPVQRVLRNQVHQGRTRTAVISKRGCEFFDQVVMACHSDQALRLLADPTVAEREVLSAIPYIRNEVVLHTDASLLPRNRRAWSSWNVSLGATDNSQAALTYNMNILQGLRSKQTWCVTLNQTAQIRQECIKGVYHYDHPLFTLAGVAAQQRWSEINGQRGTWFCGAWWRNGFHEDGVWSAKRVASGIMQLQTDNGPTLALAS